jgi:hypothetical protein
MSTSFNKFLKKPHAATYIPDIKSRKFNHPRAIRRNDSAEIVLGTTLPKLCPRFVARPSFLLVSRRACFAALVGKNYSATCIAFRWSLAENLQ